MAFDPLFGFDRDARDEQPDCSRCCGPTDDVPLMLWSEDGRTLWIYCDDCAAVIFAKLRPRLPSPPGRAGEAAAEGLISGNYQAGSDAP